MTRTTLTFFSAVLAIACGDGSQTAQRSPQTAPSMAAEPVEQAPATMSVRSGPAEVPAATEVEWQAALARAREEQNRAAGGGGGGGMRHEDHPFVGFIEERTKNLSGDQAARLVKGMLNAGLQADPNDPCARVMAMVEELGAPLEPSERRAIEEECERQPAGLTGCLKPERERTPYERRACRRFLTTPREDLPDIFGTNGAALRGGQGGGDGPVRTDGPVRVEVPVPDN